MCFQSIWFWRVNQWTVPVGVLLVKYGPGLSFFQWDSSLCDKTLASVKSLKCSDFRNPFDWTEIANTRVKCKSTRNGKLHYNTINKAESKTHSGSRTQNITKWEDLYVMMQKKSRLCDLGTAQNTRLGDPWNLSKIRPLFFQGPFTTLHRFCLFVVYLAALFWVVFYWQCFRKYKE